MAIGDTDIVRTAALFILRHGAKAPAAARRTYEALSEAGYVTSPAVAAQVLAAIARLNTAATSAIPPTRPTTVRRRLPPGS